MEYQINERGERVRVVLTVEEYEELVEAAEEADDIAAHDEAMEELQSGRETRTLRRASGS